MFYIPGRGPVDIQHLVAVYLYLPFRSRVVSYTKITPKDKRARFKSDRNENELNDDIKLDELVFIPDRCMSDYNDDTYIIFLLKTEACALDGGRPKKINILNNHPFINSEKRTTVLKWIEVITNRFINADVSKVAQNIIIMTFNISCEYLGNHASDNFPSGPIFIQ